jgi:prenyltransferase beta subunit
MNLLYRVFFSLLISISAHLSFADSNIDLALDWLVSSQDEKGGFNSQLVASWQVTEEAFQTIQSTNKLDALDTAVLQSYIESLEYTSTEFLSRKTAILSDLGQDTSSLLQALIANQNFDGGFGGDRGFGSNVYDTVFALRALVGDLEGNREAIFYALEYLKSQQEEDGGFKLVGNLTSPIITSSILVSLQPYLFDFVVVK